MTEMPELVTILHSFVGLAAVIGEDQQLYRSCPRTARSHGGKYPSHSEVFIGIFIIAVTFTGSLVAFGKLCGKLSSRPLMLPHRHKLDLLALIVSFLLLLWFVSTDSSGAQGILPCLSRWSLHWLSAGIWLHSIGGADMPVVVSMPELLFRLGGDGGRLRCSAAICLS
ncbi:NAD(P)(+) transhydrogenase (Re/Si-specific) subunit beta [Pantoea ananatis]